MKNSLKQMLRTPVRTALFLILMVFAALLMTLGVCIRLKGTQTMAQYEDRFMTIGTVRQIPDSFEQTLEWDAETKDYEVIKRAQYTSYYTTEELLFPDAEYLAEPEQRAFYVSYVPEYLMYGISLNPNEIVGGLIAEFSPLEDCMPNESVQIKITKVIGGDERLEGVVDYFCDHNNPNPEMLYKDKTYATILDRGLYIHGKAYEEKMKSKGDVYIGLEYWPGSLESGLRLPDGSIVENSFQDGQKIFEVTDGFYETDAGKRLLNLGKVELVWKYCQPVTGTNKTCLLMPFYNGQAYICEGRDINEEEYASGSKVCLAPKTFMKNNGLSLGDSVKVQLLITDTRLNAGRRFWLDGGGVSLYGGLIDTAGEPLEVFETSEYTVVGIYDVTVSGTDSIFDPGADELIVPMESIEARDGKNLMSCGPMTDATTSFQIPNGSVDAFLASWAKYGTDKLEFTFYDMGYSQLKAGIDNMKKLSLCLLAAGVILTMLLLFFFSHLFITKQAERTAIERSLGMSKAQCRWSILSGFVLLILLGCIAGSLIGVTIGGSISAINARRTYYETTYTAGTTGTVNELAITDEANTITPALWCPLFITAVGVLIAWVKLNRSLRREPMELLSERQET